MKKPADWKLRWKREGRPIPLPLGGRAWWLPYAVRGARFIGRNLRKAVNVVESVWRGR